MLEEKSNKATAKYEFDLIEKDKKIDSLRKENHELCAIKIGYEIHFKEIKALLRCEEDSIFNSFMSKQNGY